MKRKGLYILATVAMLALTAGCGSNTGDENRQNQVTEATTPTEASAATATPEPTATPAPTATPKPANYMEAKGIEVLGGGWHTCKGFMAKEGDENGNPILELVDREYGFEVTVVENEGGTKVIQVALHAKPHVNEHGGYSTFAMGGFVDLETGKAFMPMDSELLQTTLIKHGNKEYELQLSVDFEYPSLTYPYYTETYTLVCPSDYEDAGFYLTGYTYDWETFVERAGLWKQLNFIRHGDSELLVFGVNKGLATEPEKAPVTGAELAEENYFETNGFTAKSEGEYTWLGTEALRRWNEESGLWESVSLEEKELTTTVSITEELIGDGTKQIKWNMVEILEMVSEDEVKIPYRKCGIADKKTGLVYLPRAYSLAEPYVLAKDGETITILVGKELVEEDLGDGRVKASATWTLICPEDYNDAVFFLTAEAEIDEDEHTYSNESEVLSLNELEHGEYELLFFR